MAGDRLEEVARELYGLRPEDFVAARDAAAKQARTSADRALAAEVKRLRRPSVAAWAVNLLARERPDTLRQLLDLGASMREAQAALDADTLRELMRQRRRLVASVTAEAASLAEGRGQGLSDAVVRQVEETLQAAMADSDAGTAVASGVLATALSSTGLASLTDALGYAATTRSAEPRPRDRPEAQERPRLSVVEGAEQKPATAAREARLRSEREAQRTARREAELEIARKSVAKAAKRRSKREAKVLQLEAELEELRLRLSELEHARDAAADDLAEAEGSLRAAQQAVDELDGR